MLMQRRIKVSGKAEKLVWWKYANILNFTGTADVVVATGRSKLLIAHFL
jgi:hypothetical protein